MLKRIFCIIFVLSFAGSCYAQEKTAAEIAGNAQINREPLVISSHDSDQAYHLQVEVVKTPRLIKQGLMYRKDLPEDAGMLFLFNESKPRAFWMKNTYIPLDMYFIREDGVIRHIHENAQPLDETPVPSYGNAMAVLEVNGGTTQRLGIKPGDVIHHAHFGNNLAQ